MKKLEIFERRKRRNAFRVKANNKGNRPILNVFRSNKNIYAQVVDAKGKVLVTASSKSKEIADRVSGKSGVDIAAVVGELLAKNAEQVGVLEAAFNKGPYLYTGRVKALADSARQHGLKF
jgi:large subunit ribosomal protein L18